MNRADELRRVLRLDLIVYAVIGVVCVLALASLHPAVQVDHALIGALITFVAGGISGLFAYLRYQANGKAQVDEEEAEDGDQN